MPVKKRRIPKKARSLSIHDDKIGPKCGLCGKSRKIIKTECCSNWICDDEDKYVMFSYARNSCSRNHRTHSLCAQHFNEGHDGEWQTCQDCKDTLPTEMYVWYGTNQYNFERLKDPPRFEPTKCATCKTVIRLAFDGYSIRGGEYHCQECTDALFAARLAKFQK